MYNVESQMSPAFNRVMCVKSIAGDFKCLCVINLCVMSVLYSIRHSTYQSRVEILMHLNILMQKLNIFTASNDISQ